MDVQLSAYEKLRLANIAANNAMLAELAPGTVGRDASSDHPTMPRGGTNARRSKRRPAQATATSSVTKSATRRSTRSRGPVEAYDPGDSFADGASDGPTAKKPRDAAPHWVAREFADEPSTTGLRCRFNRKRHHQHLSLSKSAASVATTGCAGYGCALASPIAAGTPGGNCIGTAASAPKTEGGAKQPPSDAGTTATTSEWQVAAKHFGVGGFAVGVARSAWKGPYKSIGKTVGAGAVYHSTGCLLASRKVTENFGPEYEAGDIITVRLSGPFPARKPQKNTAGLVLSFAVNGAWLGRDTTLPASAGPYVLAVQPYMGGVARIVGAVSTA